MTRWNWLMMIDWWIAKKSEYDLHLVNILKPRCVSNCTFLWNYISHFQLESEPRGAGAPVLNNVEWKASHAGNQMRLCNAHLHSQTLEFFVSLPLGHWHHLPVCESHKIVSLAIPPFLNTKKCNFRKTFITVPKKNIWKDFLQKPFLFKG